MDAADAEFPEGQAPQDAMKYPYQLYGVATRRDVVYLLHPDIKSDVPGAKQWWRVQYDTESSNPTIMRDRLTLQEVLERATSESASVLLIYANEIATSSEPSPLSKPLEDFARKDNLNFLEELQKSSTSWDTFENYGDVAQGDWTSDQPNYNDENNWTESAQAFHNHGRNDSNMSSATLTPNTEIDEDGPIMQEMIDVHAAPVSRTAMSSASSGTIGGEAMDVDGAKPSQAEGKLIDIDMEDTPELSQKQHIDMSETKGG